MNRKHTETGNVISPVCFDKLTPARQSQFQESEEPVTHEIRGENLEESEDTGWMIPIKAEGQEGKEEVNEEINTEEVNDNVETAELVD